MPRAIGRSDAGADCFLRVFREFPRDLRICDVRGGHADQINVSFAHCETRGREVVDAPSVKDG